MFKDHRGLISMMRFVVLALGVAIAFNICMITLQEREVDWSGVTMAIGAVGALKIGQKYFENKKDENNR